MLGLHSNGLPCERAEPSNHYEPITKSVELFECLVAIVTLMIQMCTRINNMEALIKVLPQLETRLEKSSGVLQTERKHVSAHGYVSSDADLTTVAISNSSECTSGSSNLIKELNQVKKCKPEEGFHSDSSHQLVKYLKQLQRAQLLLVCHRVSILISHDSILTSQG